MRAMVFAAGLGTRLRPLTEKLPKCLVPVAGRPMIEYALLLLRRYGIREIIVNIHHLGDKIEEHLGNGEGLGLDIMYSREEVLLDTGGGLLGAKKFLEGGTFVVINGDVLIDVHLDRVIQAHQETEAAVTLILRRDEMADSYGPIETNLHGRIERFLGYEPPNAPKQHLEKYMFTGVHILEPKIFEYMERAAGPFSITRLTYPSMLEHGEPLYGFRFEGCWQDLGTTERLQAADEALQEGRWQPHFL